VLALVADDSVIGQSLGEQAVIQRWRELEVELVDGAPPVLDAVDAKLRAAGARPADAPSKLARTLADRYPPAAAQETPTGDAQESPTRDDPPAPPSGAPDGVLSGYVREQRDAIRANEAGVRAGDPDAVHDMRVATRRLRSTLRTFRRLLDPARTARLPDELKWLADLLGAARDGDVMAQRLAKAIHAERPELVVGPVAARVQQHLAGESAEARARLAEAFESPRYAALLDALDRLVEAPTGDKARRLRRRVVKALGRADRRLDTARDAPPDERDVRLHDSRKAYKRARYAVEVLRPVAGKAARRLAKRLTALQDVLGSHQDSIVTADLLRRYGMRAYQHGENAFSYGLLHARQEAAGRDSLNGLAGAARRARRGGVRRWLHK
jgi:CHAD domain-containing protein